MLSISLTNTTPYHSSQPGDARVYLDGALTYSRARKGRESDFPCIRTRHLPIIASGEDGESLPKRVEVPIMPANSMRHTIRALVLAPVIDAMRGKASMSVGAYAAMWSGNASGNPAGTTAPIDHILWCQRHPVVGLFGGGPQMIEGRLRVGSAIPIVVATTGIIGPGFEDRLLPAVTRLTSVNFTRRVDPVTTLDEGDLALIENPIEAITAWSAQFARGSESEDDGEAASARGLRAFSAHESVIPGVRWAWSIGSARSLTSAQLGAVLDAISRLGTTRVGGMSRIGYGEIRVDSIRLDGEEIWDGRALIDSPRVSEALTAWADAIDTIKAADFERFVEVPE